MINQTDLLAHLMKRYMDAVGKGTGEETCVTLIDRGNQPSDNITHLGFMNLLDDGYRIVSGIIREELSEQKKSVTSRSFQASMSVDLLDSFLEDVEFELETGYSIECRLNMYYSPNIKETIKKAKENVSLNGLYLIYETWHSNAIPSRVCITNMQEEMESYLVNPVRQKV